MAVIYVIFTIIVVLRPGYARSAVANIVDFVLWFLLLVLERIGDIGRDQRARRVVHNVSHEAGRWIWAGINMVFAILKSSMDFGHWLAAWPLQFCKGTSKQGLPPGSNTANIEGNNRTTPESADAVQTCAGYSGKGRCGRKTPRADIDTDWYCFQHKLQAVAVAEGVVFARVADRHEAR